MNKVLSFLLALAPLIWPTPLSAEQAPDRLCFLRAVPEPDRSRLPDDGKLLLGWTFDSAAIGHPLKVGGIVDRASTFPQVPGLAAPTSVARLGGQFRLSHAPFDLGRGYYGLAFAALDHEDQVEAILLANRLFRLPVALREPIGLATDIATNGAILLGSDTTALDDATEAAETSLEIAATAGVPLILLGQSQAGGTAQLQAARLRLRHPESMVPFGFLTFNAAPAMQSVARTGIAPGHLDGVNVTKDQDPFFGPHGLAPNAVGLQLYVHRDGTTGVVPEAGSFLQTIAHPEQHFLDSFGEVSIGPALAALLERPPCPSPPTMER